MNATFKRLLSLVMVLVMVLSLVPAAGIVSADEIKENAAIANTDIAPEDPIELAYWLAEHGAFKKATDEQFAAYEKLYNEKRAEAQAKKNESDLTDADYASADDVFAQIEVMENSPEKKGVSHTKLADAAQELVMASDSYVEGSLTRNGDSFTWFTEEGIRCIYDPRMREIEDNMDAPENALADGAYNEPIMEKGGTASGTQVYLIGPYYGYDSSFTDQYKQEASRIARAIGDTDGYTLYSGSAANIDAVATAVANGAVVLFDSHGSTDYSSGDDYVTGANYSYLCLKSSTGLTTADYNGGAAYSGGTAYVTGNTITNHMTKNSPSGIVWMAICLGMATNTLCTPLRNKGVEVVCGYSQSVTFGGEYLFEEEFWDNMLSGSTVANSSAAMKTAWGNWDWSTKIASYYGYSDGYSTIAAARADYAAFPVVVSDEDTHPGQRSRSSYGACSLQTVKSTYKLTITNNGSSDNPSTDNDSDMYEGSEYERLRYYIANYGDALDDGTMVWLIVAETSDYTYYFALQNWSTGILFDLIMISPNMTSLDAEQCFLYQPSSASLSVDFILKYYYNGYLTDKAEITGTINRTTITPSKSWSVTLNNPYLITNDIASEYFTVTMQLLLAIWDEEIYWQHGFGLVDLDFSSYGGYESGSISHLESEHNYANNIDEEYYYCYDGDATKLTITFHSSTLVENKYDFIYIYNGSGSQIGKYTNTELAGQSITVNDRRFIIRLTSDSSNGKYGFKVTNVKATLPEPEEEIPAGLVYSISGSTATITDYTGTASQITIPSKIQGATVTTIAEDAFAYNETLTNITLPETLTTIESCAFYCSKLTTVTIPAKVSSIGVDAFGFCESLNSITVASGNNYFSSDNYGVLFNKNKTTLIQAPGAITSYTIPSSVTTIGDSAFYFCIKLTSVTISSSVKAIERYAFANCNALTKITIPSSVISIGEYALASCNSMTSISVNSSNSQYSSDGGVLFNKNKTTLIQAPGAITSYSIPNTVTTIGDSAFDSCAKLTSITIPNSVKLIEDFAFYYCEKLTTVTIPDSVTSIGAYAFYSCEALTTLTIGRNVRTIGEDAFAWCTNLRTIYFTGTEARWNTISFADYWDYETGNYTVICTGTAISGDMDGDGDINNRDVEYLLWHTLFPDDYPIPGDADFNGDGRITNKDVEYMLWHTLFPDDYPI